MMLPPDHPFTFGAYLRALRRQRALTLDEVVARSGGLLSKTTLSIVEREDDIPNSRILEGLGKAYGVSSPYLYAIAYLTKEKRSPEAIGSTWEEFQFEISPEPTPGTPLSIFVPRVTRERLNLNAPTVRFYSVDPGSYISLEASRLGFICTGDIIAVDSVDAHTPEGLCVGWWKNQQGILLYRAPFDTTNVIVRQADGSGADSCLPTLSEVDPLGKVVWRAGALPRSTHDAPTRVKERP